MSHFIVSEELELLERVLHALGESADVAHPSEVPIVRELERIRELLVTGQESKDRLALLEEWQRNTALLAQLRRSRSAPRVEAGSPYFAHLRLREAGAERDLCLGKATCIRGGVRVVDWRNAPVSRVFYRYGQGETYEEEFGGRPVEGEVVVRRTVTIRQGRLERIDAPEGGFVREEDAPGGWRRLSPEASRLGGGEGAALRAHGPGRGAGRHLGTDAEGRRPRRDKHLPDIAGLLDPMQFELITRPAPGLLVVRGSAGSGKTTVALHRVAYLAHQDAGIDSARTLFLTFSPALRDYVSHVLPSLGVQRVLMQTFAEWALRRRMRLYPRLPRAQRTHTPAAVRRLKLHPALGLALEERIREVAGPRSWEQAMDDWASLLTDRVRLETSLARHGARGLGPAALAEAVEWSRRRNDELFAWLEGDREVQAELDPEDDALLLRAWQLRVGPLLEGGRPLAYRHLTVDEVQDLSTLELRVLLDCLVEPPSVTLAGDTQQHIVEDSGFTSWGALFEQLGIDDAEATTLRVSYRSSHEIMDFARGVLGPLWEDEAPPEAVRGGPPVELFEFTDHGGCVAFLAEALRRLAAEEPLASVAVLTPSRGLSALYYEGLERSDVPRLRQVVTADFRFAPGVEVTEIDQAKGLEFDYVVLVDVSTHSFPEDDLARRRLHVGATRAIHQLWLTCVGESSPLVRSLAD